MTLAELRSWVRRQTLITTAELADADLNKILQQGLLDVAARYQWPWAYKTATIALAAGTPSYSLPADTMWIRELIHDNVGRTRLARTDLEAIKAEYGDVVGSSDLPDRYYLDALDKVTFVPTPAAIKTVNVFYYATPDMTAFDADGESPPFHSAYHIALAEYAASVVWEQLEQADRNQALFQRYFDTISRMADFYGIRLPAGPLVIGAGSLQNRVPYRSYLDI